MSIHSSLRPKVARSRRKKKFQTLGQARSAERKRRCKKRRLKGEEAIRAYREALRQSEESRRLEVARQTRETQRFYSLW